MSVVDFRRRAAFELRRPTVPRRRSIDLCLVGLLGLITLIALFPSVLAPYNPIQPVGGLANEYILPAAP